MRKNFHSKLDGSAHRTWKSLFLIFAITTSVCSAPQKTAGPPIGTAAPVSAISIIPKPVSIIPGNGSFVFSRDTRIIAGDESAVPASTSLNTQLQERYGFELKGTPNAKSQNSITFSTDNAIPDQSGEGAGYSLKITPGTIQITGSGRGMVYGISSLLQLLPVEIKGVANIPTVEITDAPRFRYRGMHLDVARHFMPVDFVKKFIRLISRYKFNYFHWHLTDDQGWRIEIKKYPMLTTIGSMRPEMIVETNLPPTGGDPQVEFYNQREIRDIVEYASARNVTIIPEIEMPGHSSAALAADPKLGCCKNCLYEVQIGRGVFPSIFCPTEYTFQFLGNVLNEVIGLFPKSPYIHIGGDEVVKTESWKLKEVQDIKRANNLSTDREVQSWFIKRVESYVKLKDKDRKIIVWDDMIDVGAQDLGLPPGATVMYWADSELSRRKTDAARRTVSNAVLAARANHDVIMTPDVYTYFDHQQVNMPKQEVQSLYATHLDMVTPLDKVYYFEPVPAGLTNEEAKYIIGGQGCIWTEVMKTPGNVEYMMIPRALALAEVLWSKPGNKDFTEFKDRLHREFRYLDWAHVNRRKEMSPR